MGAGIVVIDGWENKLKLYDHGSQCISRSSTDISMGSVLDMARVTGDTFVICGGRKVLWWAIRGQIFERDDKEYISDHAASAICFDGSVYYVTHFAAHSITVLDSKGRKVREIVTKDAGGVAMQLGWGICIDSETQNIYRGSIVSGVICLSQIGEQLRYYSFSNQVLHLRAINGLILVAVHNGVIKLTTEGEKYIVKANIGIKKIDAFEKNIALLHSCGTQNTIIVFTADFNKGK